MRVIVDHDRCESNGICMVVLPEVFELEDDDTLHLLQDRPPEALRSRLLEAIRRCPMMALSVEE